MKYSKLQLDQDEHPADAMGGRMNNQKKQVADNLIVSNPEADVLRSIADRIGGTDGFTLRIVAGRIEDLPERVETALRIASMRCDSAKHELAQRNVGLRYCPACIRRALPALSYSPAHYVLEAMKTQQALKELRQSGFKFYLTGSRFFGTATPASDWDFFATDSNELNDFLLRKGYKVQFTAYSRDLGRPVVYAHPLVPIHIQLYRNVARKLRAQELLVIHGALSKPLSRAESVRLWRNAWEAAGE